MEVHYYIEKNDHYLMTFSEHQKKMEFLVVNYLSSPKCTTISEKLSSIALNYYLFILMVVVTFFSFEPQVSLSLGPS